MNKRKVFLVGSGPGDTGLLTVRAKELIERCEVLIYDNLVDESIVTSLPRPDCEKIYVGKSGGKHTMEQESINKLIVAKAQEDKFVVRLKGGDPYIFGRGGEEAVTLAENGIGFEVVNGISSAYAVPNYAGIPVTNRGYSASVAFITGHEDPTKPDSDIHWDKIATGVQTIVFLMGLKNLPLIAKKLVENGLSSATPVAVIQNGCRPTQRSVAGTLADITDIVVREKIRPPSIIVVGEVVSLRREINWFETRPLFGKSILVTRSREQASELTTRLLELGANVIETPVIKIIPPDDPAAIAGCIRDIAGYDWIILTSVNGVDYFFKYLAEAGFDSRKLAGAKICAIGSSTAERLNRFGILPDMVPEKFVSTEIVKALIARGEVKGKSFFLPRADIAPKGMPDALAAAGARKVDDIPVYRTVPDDLSGLPGVAEILAESNFDMVTFTSSSTVRNFDRALEKYPGADKKKILCASIGPVTTATAKKLGYAVEIDAEVHTIEGLVQAILDHYGK